MSWRAVVVWTIVGTATAAYACLLLYFVFADGGIRSWWRDRDSVLLAAGSAGAFGLVVAMFWALALNGSPE